MDNYFDDMVRSAAQASIDDEQSVDKNLTILQKLDCVLLNLSIFRKDLDEVKKQQADLIAVVKMMNDANAMKSYPVFIPAPSMNYYSTSLPYISSSISSTSGNT